jgi:ComF family protein
VFSFNLINFKIVFSKYIIDLNNSSFTEVLSDFASLFFPKYCRGCQEALVKGEELICTNCLLELPRSRYHLEQENPFYNRLRGRIPVSNVMTLFKFVKSSRVQHLLHALKYKNQPELGNALGRMYGHDLLEAGYKEKFDLIIPVPLHPSKKRRRGYNQSEEFGKGLSAILEIPCSDDYIKRLVKTETQTKKTRLNRWQNVSEVFLVTKPEKIQGHRVLLVDDVVTTGATLEACGKMLLDAGCKELSIACIASTQ